MERNPVEVSDQDDADPELKDMERPAVEFVSRYPTLRGTT